MFICNCLYVCVVLGELNSALINVSFMLAFRYYNICMQSFFFILRIKVLFQRLKSSKDELKTKHSGSNVHSMATLHVLGLLHGILAALPGILAALHVLGYYMASWHLGILASWLHFRSWATTWHLGCTSGLGLIHGRV